MNREKRKRRLQVKIQLEKLETRWLMRSGLGLTSAPHLLATPLAERETRTDALSERLASRVEHWLNDHPLAIASGDLTQEKRALEKLVSSHFSEWGALRLLGRMEADGRHQFDALYTQIAAKFDVWEQHHSVQAAATGITAAPLQTVSADSNAPAPSSATIVSIAPGASPQPGSRANSGPMPDAGAPPPIVPVDTFGFFSYCCPHNVDAVSPPPSGPCCGAPPSAPVPNNSQAKPQAPLNSDASLITGELLEDHQLATYQSQGQLNGIDLQYTSLQAGSDAVIAGAWSVNTNVGSGSITHVTVGVTVDGISQGSAATITSVPGIGPYLVEFQAPSASTLPTGIYSDTLTFTKYHPSGPTTADSFTGTLLVDDGSSSPYGAGWSIGGLQQITVGTPNRTAMITGGSSAPEEFTSSNGINYTGYITDTSSLTFSSSSNSYTRSYPDGSVIIFNSSGQETSVADRNGNTTSFSYVTSGAAAGALHTITDPVGLVTTLSFDSNGHLNTVTDPASHVTTFTVGSSTDSLTEIVDPTGAATQYGYNSSHEMTSETNPDNQTATITYDSFNLFGSETLFDGTSRTSVSAADEADLIAYGSSGTLSSTLTYIGTVTDPNNATTALTFDPTGGVIEETDGRGEHTYITNNGNDWPVTVMDPVHGTTTYQYDSFGDITEIIRPDGSSETIAYDDSFEIPTAITDFNGLTTTYALDSHGNVTQRTDPDGLSEGYTYNSAGQILTDTDPRAKTTSYVYNSLGRLTEIIEPGTTVGTIQYGYDPAGDTTTVTDEVGDTTSYTYDTMGRVLTEQDPVQAVAGKDTAYVYDPAGNLTSVTDALGRTVTYTYSARNELISVEEPTLAITTFGYDAEGNNTTVTDARGNTSSYTYDQDNDLVSATDALHNITTYVYDNDDEEISSIDPRGNTTDFTYNNLGEESTMILPGQTAATTYTYDEDGNELSVTDQLGDKTVYTYNNMNWMATETVYPNGSTPETTSFTYDADGDLATVTDGLSHTTSYSYDAMGDELTETDPTGGGTTSYSYDLAGRLITLTDPDNNVTTWTYTHVDEIATEVNPLGYATSYAYDLVGNVTNVVDPNSHTITYSYDGDNRETGETWINPAGGSALNLITVTYDADGDMTQIKDANTNYQYSYNADDEVLTAADNGTTGLPLVTLTYGYDADGDETSLTDSKGGVVSYTFDVRNELTNETFSGTGLSAEAVTYAYDNAGRLTGLTRYSNLAETTKVAATAYSFDHADRMTGIVDSNSTGATLVTYGYNYDAADRVSQETRTWASGASTDTLTYTYTNNNQLTGVSHTNVSFTNESFSYDTNGNETGTGYTTGTDNEQTASTGYTSTYDHAGNMTAETQTSTGDVWTYSYDFRGRMTGAVEKTSGGTTLESVTFTYDALDNRTGIDENSTQTWTLYDGGNPIMDFNGSATLTMRYLWGPTGIIARQTSGGTVSWYLADHLGTVRDLINNSGGIIDHVDFSAFGTVLAETSPTSGDRMTGFAMLERDTVTELNLAIYREENPGTGRWDSQDPTGFQGGYSNTFSYLGNGPTAGTDPAGLGGPLYPKPPWDPECRRLRSKIENVRQRIGKRISDLRENGQPRNGIPREPLREACLGDLRWPGLSKRGHRRLINEDKALLAALQAEYCWKCTGYSLPVLVPERVPEANPQPSPNNTNYWVAGGLILGGIVVGVGTIVEDIVTGGVGALDDVPTLGAAGTLVWRGGQILVGAGH